MSDRRRTDATQAFLEEVLEVCKKHRLSLTHEDPHGGFIVEPYSVTNAMYLLGAADSTYVEVPKIEEG